MKQTVSFSKNVTNLFLHITTRCNLRCRHCYINPDQHGKNDLTIDEIHSCLKIFSRKNRFANVIFLGGEPTIHPELPEAVRLAREMGFRSITIDTNGSLFHGFLDRITPEEVDFLSFSLDGPTPEMNDPIRGKGVFQTCILAIEKARNKGFATSLIYTVSRANIEGLPEMLPILQELCVERFFIQVIGIRGESAKNPKGSQQLTKNEWESVVPQVAEKAAEQGIIATYPRVFLLPDEEFVCAGNVADNFFVFPNGRVYRCPLCEDYPLHAYELIGNELVKTRGINESHLFPLSIPEGCVMNRIIQPGNIRYGKNGKPDYKIACCLLKEEIKP